MLRSTQTLSLSSTSTMPLVIVSIHSFASSQGVLPPVTTPMSQVASRPLHVGLLDTYLWIPESQVLLKWSDIYQEGGDCVLNIFQKSIPAGIRSSGWGCKF